jgi:TetR/AcrR family transcriptional regulator, mexJK operon transcriptional repressor
MSISPARTILQVSLIDDECRKLGPQLLWQPSDEPIDLAAGLRAIARGYSAFFRHDRGLGLHRLII